MVADVTGGAPPARGARVLHQWSMDEPAARSVVELLGPSTGGIRAHVGELTRRLGTGAWRVSVVGPVGVMADAGRQDGVVDVPSGWNPLAVVRARRQLETHLRSSPADVLHAHGSKAALVALLVRRDARRPPIVVTVHNLVAGTQRGVAARVLSVVERALLRRVDHVVVISDEIAEHVRGVVPPERLTFVLPVAPPRTVGRRRHDVREGYGIDEAAPLVVIVARHHPQKDLPMFLRAFARVVAALPDARAIVVGDGPERSRIEAERRRLGLERSVVIAGFRPNPVDEMHAADVVALSSRWEGSPLAVVECLSLGRPLVTTAVGTVTRHLTDGVDARIVPVGDDAAFAAALVDLLSDPERSRVLGRAAGQLAGELFDPDRLASGVADVYRRVIERTA
ncbi:MAG: glycosyltransferase family 4 protein [Ilumatobacteraceae bacterium]